MIYGDDLPFVADVRRLLRERSPTEDEILRNEDDELLFLPLPCNLSSLLSAQEAPASEEDSYRALEDKNDALQGPTVATIPRELRLRCDTREQRARSVQEQRSQGKDQQKRVCICCGMRRQAGTFNCLCQKYALASLQCGFLYVQADTIVHICGRNVHFVAEQHSMMSLI